MPVFAECQRIVVKAGHSPVLKVIRRGEVLAIDHDVKISAVYCVTGFPHALIVIILRAVLIFSAAENDGENDQGATHDDQRGKCPETVSSKILHRSITFYEHLRSIDIVFGVIKICDKFQLGIKIFLQLDLLRILHTEFFIELI